MNPAVTAGFFGFIKSKISYSTLVCQHANNQTTNLNSIPRHLNFARINFIWKDFQLAILFFYKFDYGSDIQWTKFGFSQNIINQTNTK